MTVRTALVTGASGFSAAHLAKRLRDEHGVRIVGSGRSAPQAGLFDDYVQADPCSASDIAGAVRSVQPDLIFHLAGTGYGDPGEVIRSNVLPTVYLLDAVRSLVPAAKLLLVGSAAEYGPVTATELPITEAQACRPGNAYGSSKLAATLMGQAAAASGMHVVIARPFNIVGPGVPRETVVGALLHRIRAAAAGGGVVHMGNLHTERDFVAVEDVVDAYVRLLHVECWGRVFNLCSGIPRSIQSVVEMIVSAVDRPVKVEIDPALLRPDDVPVSYGSWQQAHAAIGFTPSTSLESSLRAATQAELGVLL